MMSSLADQRLFYLMLSTYTGRDITEDLGLTPPSEDVASRERQWVANQWEAMFHLGIFGEVVESVEWFANALKAQAPEGQEPSDEMLEGAKTMTLSFGMAMLQKLMMSEKIALIGEVEIE